MKNIYLIVGESGSGKTTIAEALREKYGLTQVTSYTNRPPRSDDEVGHCFISGEVFPTFEEIDRCFPDIVASATYDGYCYFCTATQIDTNDLYVIDPDGVSYLRTNYDGDRGMKVIYVRTSPEQRMSRMLTRGDSSENIARRVKHDEVRFLNASVDADHIADNTNLSKCVSDIYAYMTREEEKRDQDVLNRMPEVPHIAPET